MLGQNWDGERVRDALVGVVALGFTAFSIYEYLVDGQLEAGISGHSGATSYRAVLKYPRDNGYALLLFGGLSLGSVYLLHGAFRPPAPGPKKSSRLALFLLAVLCLGLLMVGVILLRSPGLL